MTVLEKSQLARPKAFLL